ncbi:MAG: diacylglycerol O-acyltransferase / wax synthase [Actinomycetota bacterium]|nr:diacylglycerol O-acyltransferase / wax synthase [Actinomycetota bacterium]
MWAVERDPALRSSFLNVTFLDRSPDFDRFRRRMDRAVAAVPRLRQRVTPAGLIGVPGWEPDPEFDIDFHVRRIDAPPDGSDRVLLDMAAALYAEEWAPDRPLWQFTIVDGLEGDRAALLAKMHHTITDGVGGVRLSAMFLDLERDAPEPEINADADDELPGEEPTSLLDAIRRPLDLTRKAIADVADSVTHPVETAQSMARQVLVTDRARSTLWRGKRSMHRRFDVLRFPLDDAKRAAKALGGTINDFFMTGVAGGAADYHRKKGAEVTEFRVAMPISTRTDRSAGGNAFAPTRVLVPVGLEDPAARFAAVREQLNTVKSERALGLAETLAGVLSSLPTPVLARLARFQVETVDFACSNVKGAPFDLYVAGAKVLANHPMGPTAGTAFNATLLSYLGSLDIGINSDTAAVDDPALLVQCIEESLRELATVAP